MARGAEGGQNAGMSASEGPGSVEEYLRGFPEDARAMLEAIRAVVRAEVPGVEETISYRMPTFTLDGRRLVHVAGWKKHVSLYPMPEGDADLARDAAAYVAGRGTVQFPLARPLPIDLVGRIVRALVAERG